MKASLGLFAGIAVTALALCLSPAAQAEFRPLGSVTYEPEPSDLKVGTFEIRPEDRGIRSIRFSMERGEAEIRTFRVYYSDGDSERFRVRETFEEGERTEIFDIESDRPIRKIEIAFVPTGNVKIALLAETRRAEPPPPPPPPPPLAWRELSCQDVSFLNDRDRVRLPVPKVFVALRLRAEVFDVQVSDMTVRYQDGSNERLRINTVVPAGAKTNAIDIRAEGRRLAEIEINYGSTGFGTRTAQMCFDGQ